ncbi:putative polyketide synthase [Aspergillus recurvatus]
MSEPIAVIGFAFEFPGATSNDHFWKIICEGRSMSTDIPPSRFNVDAFYHSDAARASTFPVRGGHFLQRSLGDFDAPFFSITPGEVACMDPQHLGMLETAYHALEDAGIPMSECSGSETSVYTGCFTNDYLSVVNQDYNVKRTHAAMGVAPSMLANRVSWFFNLKGTSMNLDSACSSSLVALHLACRDLQLRTASMALVGGANLVFHPNFMKMMAAFNFLSPDSRCWSFDDRANGYARGEGLVMVVLKRLGDALRDGNTIRAVIRSTASNQDGWTPGITQPSIDSQIRLIKQVYQRADLNMEPTRFFEAHGTGTVAGDYSEANAIGQAFSGSLTPESPLHIGAVKANIGHLEGASGLASLIKTILVLENGVIPPIAGLEELNSRIDADGLCLRFPKQAIPWPTKGLRRSCVNSFGFGGTNAAVVLDDAYHYLALNGLSGIHRTRQVPPLDCEVSSFVNDWSVLDARVSRIPAAETPVLLVWSAADMEAAQGLTNAYRELVTKRKCDLLSIAYSTVQRRSRLQWRAFMVSHRGTGLLLDQHLQSSPLRVKDSARLTYIFTGQGAQYLGMGRELFSFAAFRESLLRCDQCLQQLECTWSLLPMLEGDVADISVEDPKYGQPLTTCLQIALIDLLKSLGISPDFVLGHSSGEIAAAYAVGGLSRFSAVLVAFYRGSLSSQLASATSGLSMMAVGISRADVQSYLSRLESLYGSTQVSVGCVNSPKNITLTGAVDQLEILQGWFQSDNITARKLRIPLAYHSETMTGIITEYRSLMSGRLESGGGDDSVCMVSSVTGDNVQTSTLNSPQYWIDNLVSVVNFEGALAKLISSPCKHPQNQNGHGLPSNLRTSHLLEIGPHNSLQGPTRETLQAYPQGQKLTYIPLLIRKQTAHIRLLEAAGLLYCAGFPVDLLAVNSIPQGNRMPMPRDMPQYPFTHTRSHWQEGRLSENFRLKGAPQHDLLGTRSVDWNPQLAQWRNILRIEEVPWLRDHTIEGQIVVPAAAMVVMAVEALRALQATDGALTGIELRNARFLHPMRFTQDSDELETQLSLSPLGDSVRDHAVWIHFRLFVIENGSYTECCRGDIRRIIDQRRRTSHTIAPTEGLKAWAEDVIAACKLPIDAYATVAEGPLRYGPCFQNLESLRVSTAGEAIADVNLDTWRTAYKERWSQASNYLVHPCTVDALLQLVLPAQTGGKGTLPTMVPAEAERIYIDCSACREIDNGKIAALARGARVNRGTVSDIVGMTIETSRPILSISKLRTRFIDSVTARPMDSGPRPLCKKLIWRPSIATMTNEQILHEITRERPREPEATVRQFHESTLVILCFIHEALNYVDAEPSISLPAHLLAYIKWMKYQQELFYRSVSSTAALDRLLADKRAREQLIAKVEESGTEGSFYTQVGRNLIPVLRGDVDPLDLLFGDGLADRYYESMLSNPVHAHPAVAYLQHLSFQSPALTVLEVGAGTGGQTLGLLEAITADGSRKCTRYNYTDISPAFLARAQEKLKDYSDIVQYCMLDISQDPLAQSFKTAEYDLVIASHVLHATAKLEESVRNIRTVLKPGGKLILFETTSPDVVHVGFATGLLTSWWTYLDHEARSGFSPFVDTSRWNEILKNTGFSGVDVEVPGQEHVECRYSSIIISTAIGGGSASTAERDQILLVVDRTNASQVVMAQMIKKYLPVSVISLDELGRVNIELTAFVVSLVEIHAVVLDGISPNTYGNLHSLLTQTKNILWVSQPACEDDLPHQHLAEGLGRSLASEDSTRKFVTLVLDSREPDEEAAKLILMVTEHMQVTPIESLEANWRGTGGILHVPRVYGNDEADKTVAQALKKHQEVALQITSDTHFGLRLDASGAPRFVEESPHILPLEADEVLVQVKAVGLSFRDYLVFSGQIDQQGLGLECSGVIIAAGEKAGYSRGARVCVIGTQLAKCHVRTHIRNVVPIPASLGFIEAASLPASLWIAHHALYHLARLQQHETVLILHASSSIGQMLVQMATHQGARVLATASTCATKDFICNSFGVAEANVILLEDGASLDSVSLGPMKGTGIDVVVGPLSGYNNLDLSDCLAPCSRVVDTSISDIRLDHLTLLKMQAESATYASLNMAQILKAKRTLSAQTMQEAIHLYIDQNLRPPRPLKVFQAGDIGAAFENFQSTDGYGKRIIEFADETPIKVDCLTKPLYTFSADASYAIAGGLGGLGRSIARWMVARGARHLILLSRSGVSTSAANYLVQELQQKGAHIATPKVDISDLSKLAQVIASLASTFPPVDRGVQDKLFANMSHEDWTVSTNAKVAGSWNLHTSFQNLDFFILIASLNGIFGNRAQANYAAGNTFQDALARYRLAKGQKAVAIDLGMVVDEGFVATNESVLASLRRLGHLMELQQEELLALLDYYCNPSLPLLSADDAQVLVGLELPSKIAANGFDLHHSMKRPIFSHLFQMGPRRPSVTATVTSSVHATDRPAALKVAGTQEEAASLVIDWASAKISHVLGLPMADLDPAKPLHAYGMDSLVAVDLKNWFEKEIGASVSVFDLMSNTSIRQLAETAAEKSRFRS